MAAATKTRSKKTRKTQVRVPLSSERIREPDSSQVSPPLTQISREQEPLENAVAGERHRKPGKHAGPKRRMPDVEQDARNTTPSREVGA